MIEGVKITDFLERKKNYQKHMMRLGQINKRKHSQTKQQHIQNYHLLKQRTRRIKTDELNKSVQDSNQKLLHRIVDISTRNSETSFRKTMYRSKAHHHAYFSRVKNYEAINQENPNILKRIASQSGYISAEEQQKSYQQSLRLKMNVEKFPYTKNIKRKMKAIEAINAKKILASSRAEDSFKDYMYNNSYQQVNQIIL